LIRIIISQIHDSHVTLPHQTIIIRPRMIPNNSPITPNNSPINSNNSNNSNNSSRSLITPNNSKHSNNPKHSKITSSYPHHRSTFTQRYSTFTQFSFTLHIHILKISLRVHSLGPSSFSLHNTQFIIISVRFTFLVPLALF